MIEPEELASAPEYKWRRWWAKAGIPSSLILFMMVLGFSGNVFIALVVAGVFYAAINAKVRDLDALALGAESRDFDAVVQAALERRRLGHDEPAPPPEQPIQMQQASPTARRSNSFGRKADAPGMARKPVDLPRRLH